MGATGIGSALGSVGSQYDFTKMTNKQLFDAANELGDEGKISKTDAGQLSFISQGVDYAYPDGGGPTSVSQFLSDPTQHNFIQEIQNDERGANSPGGVGGALYASMLSDLYKVQGTSTQAAIDPISIQA
jgi:hypothetical protein